MAIKKYITRYDFLVATGMVFVIALLLIGLSSVVYGAGESSLLKGFVVSDAHFGWINAKQPTPAVQQQMMQVIMTKFPDLDVLIDTGDAHHNNATSQAKRDWTDVIPGGCNEALFYYVGGNHELDGCPAYDKEWVADGLGSVSCRPYYSFDIKGIHFVSIPQMVKVSYITEETIDWLKLDLAINQNKTTILLSHNALTGTTYGDPDNGYRNVVNTDVIMNLLDQYPKVLAWMHGHNHDYVVVPDSVKNRVYVSNGRIGGFDVNTTPALAQLGGIYFEVGPDYFTVRPFNAEQNKFFDEISDGTGYNYSSLTHTISGQTSLNPQAPPAISYGFGGARDGQRIPAFHHHAINNRNRNSLMIGHSMNKQAILETGNGKRELFITGVNSKIFNFNSDISYYSERTNGTKLTPGYSISGSYDWIDTGCYRLPSQGGTATVNIPRSCVGERTYYRCPPGSNYRISMQLDCNQGGQKVQFACNVYNSDLVQLWSQNSSVLNLQTNQQTVTYDFQVPASLSSGTIYENTSSDTKLQVSFSAIFSDIINDIDIQRCDCMFTDAVDGDTVDPNVIVDGQTFSHNGSLAEGNVISFDLPTIKSNRSVYEISTGGGSGRLTWLVRQTGFAWQVRNASVADRGHFIEVGPMRNTFSDKNEIVIVPGSSTNTPYVHRLRRVNYAKIFPASNSRPLLTIEINDILGTGTAEIEILSDKTPKTVTGSDNWNYADGRTVITVSKPGRVVMKF